MTYTWYTDPRMLAAGNARGLAGGDPDAMPVSPPRTVRGSGAPAQPAPGRTRQTAADLGLTEDQLADLHRAARAHLRHPNRKFTLRRAGAR